ncbi:hypothetical protein TNCV_4501541 [Trichonephila clavipes]|nr:hypothetical protein TNCV_4501541 [Trichonephila clavipes]
MHCLPPNDVSFFAEETNQFALNERNNFRMAKKKKRSVNIQFLNSVMKDITPFHQRNKEKEKKSSSPESLHVAKRIICFGISNRSCAEELMHQYDDKASRQKNPVRLLTVGNPLVSH